MKRWHKVLAAAIALVVINATTQVVIKANLAAGLYPPQAAIDIPIMTTLYASLAAGPCLLLLAFLSRSAIRPSAQKSSRSMSILRSSIRTAM